MRHRRIFVDIACIAVWAASASAAFSQSPVASTRIPQQIVVNGQVVSGASGTSAGGQLQTFSCSAPQQYTTADGRSQGWACYEQTTGVWLLNALPPGPAPQVVQTPTTVTYSNRPTYSPRRSAPAVSSQPPQQVIYAPPSQLIYIPAPPVVIYAPPLPYVVLAPILNSRVTRDTVTFNPYEIDRGRQTGRRR